jgi:hypothetical protein
VAILLMMETSTSRHQSIESPCSVNSIWAAAATTQATTLSRGQSRQGDRQEQSGVDRGHHGKHGDYISMETQTLAV